MDIAGRRDDHRRNPVLETLLKDLATDLAPASEAVAENGAEPRLPSVFVVGCPRSGTTLAYQWLASLGLFAYPSNLVSRFPSTPWIGARIERLLTDPACDHNGELTVPQDADADPFSSRLGKTRGLTAPHEFWYFWRRHLPERETHALSSADLAAIDRDRLLAELAAWERVRDMPLLMKGLIMDWNLPWLAETLPGALFVHVHRDPVENMASLLDARRDFFGREDRWYSFRPPRAVEVADESPAVQVAVQVHDTERGVREGLAAVPDDRWISIDYAEFCRAPGDVHASLASMLRRHGVDTDAGYAGPEAFTPRRRDLASELRDTLESAWNDIAGAVV